MKSCTILLTLLFMVNIALSQTTISGIITDEETGEPLIYANVVLQKNGVFVTGASTDFDGRYEFLVDPGTYTMQISYTGYPDHQITDIIITEETPFILDYQMRQAIIEYCYFPMHYWPPIIEIDEPGSQQKISNEAIRHLPTKNINEIILNTPGVSIQY